MLHNNVFTYCKVSGFEKKESNHNRFVRWRFHSKCCQIEALPANGETVQTANRGTTASIQVLHLQALAAVYIGIRWHSQGLPGFGELLTRKTKMRKKIMKIWGKMKETTGKWGKIEELILSCPPWRERGWLRPCQYQQSWSRYTLVHW